MTHANITNKFQLEGIKLCTNVGGTRFLVGQVEASRVGGWCSTRKGGRPGALIILVLMQWSHVYMDLSYCPHLDMVRCR